MSNLFKQYGQAAKRGGNRGQYLKFNHGVYEIKDEEIPKGTRVIGVLPTLCIGHKRFEEGAGCTDEVTGLLSEGFKPDRKALGELDKEEWELDENGNPKDPWSYSSELTFVREDDNTVYLFSTTSKGGNKAVAALCGYYGDKLDEVLSQYPIIELRSDSYPHPNSDYGRVKYPVFEVVGWTEREPYDRLLERATPAKKLTDQGADGKAKPVLKIQRNKRFKYREPPAGEAYEE